MSGNKERTRTAVGRYLDGSIVDIFYHAGRICVIRYRDMGEGYRFHNGYVSVLPEHNGLDYSDQLTPGVDIISTIQSEEMTYSGEIRHIEIPRDTWFFGFDTAHAWDFDNPARQTFNAVSDRTKILAEELVRLGI